MDQIMGFQLALPSQAQYYHLTRTYHPGCIGYQMQATRTQHRHRGLRRYHHPVSRRARRQVAMAGEAERRSKLEGWADKFEKVVYRLPQQL